MNKKVFKAMLLLCVLYLIGNYILKFIFPEIYILAIDNEKLLNIGNFIDNNYFVLLLYNISTGFITYFLYICATCQKKYLNWKEMLIVLGVVVTNNILDRFNLNLTMHLNIMCMLVLPYVFKGTFLNTIIVYGIHGLAQLLSLGIRDLPVHLMTNSATFTIMILECYIWLVLLYIVFNYREGGEKDGFKMSSILQKEDSV